MDRGGGKMTIMTVFLTVGTLLAPMAMLIRAMNVGYATLAYSGYVFAGACGAGLALLHSSDLVAVQQLCIAVVGFIGIYRWRNEHKSKKRRKK
jgi:hypothetical protein